MSYRHWEDDSPTAEEQHEMQQASYLISLLAHCAPDNGYAQDAIEEAIKSGWVTPGYVDIETDARLIMGQYDALLDWYHEFLSRDEAARLKAQWAQTTDHLFATLKAA